MMDMNETCRRRREFLKSISLGVAAIATPSCMSVFREDRTFTFAQICDTQLGMGGYEHDVNTFNKVVEQINELRPDFVVICGDLVHNASDESFADFNKIKADLAPPCYRVPGNHDVGKEPTKESLRYYRQIMGEDYYSFEHKGYLFAYV